MDQAPGSGEGWGVFPEIRALDGQESNLRALGSEPRRDAGNPPSIVRQPQNAEPKWAPTLLRSESNAATGRSTSSTSRCCSSASRRATAMSSCVVPMLASRDVQQPRLSGGRGSGLLSRASRAPIRGGAGSPCSTRVWCGVARAGLEPATSGLWAPRATGCTISLRPSGPVHPGYWRERDRPSITCASDTLTRSRRPPLAAPGPARRRPGTAAALPGRTGARSAAHVPATGAPAPGRSRARYPSAPR